jgi:hypothetical protein
MSQPTIDHLTWNIKQGGYDRRHVFDNGSVSPEDATPERGEAIKNVLSAQQKLGVRSMTLIDAYGMQERLGSNEAIAHDLASQHAFFGALNDDRIDDIYGPGAGNVYATNNHLYAARPLDMHDREGIVAIEEVGDRVVQTASLYITDLNTGKDLQLRQLRAGLANLEDDVDATLLTGDFNSLEPDMRGAPLRSKRDDLLVRAAGTFSWLIPAEYMFQQNHPQIIRTIGYMGLLARTLNHRDVLPHLARSGWQTANTAKQPTATLAGLTASPDHTHYREDQIQPISFDIASVGDASDHKLTRARFQFHQTS